jgi:hypothetical protein
MCRTLGLMGAPLIPTRQSVGLLGDWGKIENSRRNNLPLFSTEAQGDSYGGIARNCGSDGSMNQFRHLKKNKKKMMQRTNVESRPNLRPISSAWNLGHHGLDKGSFANNISLIPESIVTVVFPKTCSPLMFIYSPFQAAKGPIRNHKNRINIT